MMTKKTTASCPQSFSYLSSECSCSSLVFDDIMITIHSSLSFSSSIIIIVMPHHHLTLVILLDSLMMSFLKIVFIGRRRRRKRREYSSQNGTNDAVVVDLITIIDSLSRMT